MWGVGDTKPEVLWATGHAERGTGCYTRSSILLVIFLCPKHCRITEGLGVGGGQFSQDAPSLAGADHTLTLLP